MLQEVWVGVSDETRGSSSASRSPTSSSAPAIGHPTSSRADARARHGSRSRRRRARSRASARSPRAPRSATASSSTSPPSRDDELAHDREAEAEVAVGAAVAARAGPTARSGRTRGRAPPRVMPGPSSLTRSSTQRRGSRRDSRTALPGGATSSALFSRLSTTCSSRPGCRATHRRPGHDGSIRTWRSAANASHASQRPSTSSSTRSAPAPTAACSARASASRPSTRRERRRTSVERAVEVVSGVPAHVGFEVLEPEPERGQGRAQLVRRVGDERALRADELLEARRGRVERLREHGELGRALRHRGADRQVATAERRPRRRELASGSRHRPREQQAHQEHDAEHDPARRREQQPDVPDAVVDDRRAGT